MTFIWKVSQSSDATSRFYRKFSYVAGNRDLCTPAVLKRWRWTLKYGYCEYSPSAFASVGIFYSGLTGYWKILCRILSTIAKENRNPGFVILQRTSLLRAQSTLYYTSSRLHNSFVWWIQVRVEVRWYWPSHSLSLSISRTGSVFWKEIGVSGIRLLGVLSKDKRTEGRKPSYFESDG